MIVEFWSLWWMVVINPDIYIYIYFFSFLFQLIESQTYSLSRISPKRVKEEELKILFLTTLAISIRQYPRRSNSVPVNVSQLLMALAAAGMITSSSPPMTSSCALGKRNDSMSFANWVAYSMQENLHP